MPDWGQAADKHVERVWIGTGLYTGRHGPTPAARETGDILPGYPQSLPHLETARHEGERTFPQHPQPL
ncbi:protein of unknown function [Candidatus Hydrogenisulfobacillus filiaventi]|uniref:Uncharacterized protein n=1 Tax=Candidatus Hydrogenisulfobacillus filiaventi TaxID=2707344 RepID=A0A6F8ZCX8_9FIRM|nr:protein of unknown function [Candidatus Hydrogenisulfobacillus filiaventi]